MSSESIVSEKSANPKNLVPSWNADFYTKYFSPVYDACVALTGWRKSISQNAFADISGLPERKQNEKLKFLDIGCGTGFVLADAKKHGFEVTGIDPSSGMLKKAKEVHSLNDNELIEAYSDKLPLEEESYDYVYASGSLIHVADLLPSAREIIRVLKKDGMIRIIDHAKPSHDYRPSCLTAWPIVVKRNGYILHDYKKVFSDLGLKLIGHKTLGRGGYLQLFDFKKA